MFLCEEIGQGTGLPQQRTLVRSNMSSAPTNTQHFSGVGSTGSGVQLSSSSPGSGGDGGSYDRRWMAGSESGAQQHPDQLQRPPAQLPQEDPTIDAINASILELSRRRYAMAEQAVSMGGLLSGPMLSGYDLGINSAMLRMSQQANPASAAATLAARQQQLQIQQAELEQRQKELELQRQQLLTGFGGNHQPQDGTTLQRRPEYPSSSSVHQKDQHLHQDQQPQPQQRSQESKKQWWVCQVCQSKAFASRDEASEHEATCGRPQQQAKTHAHQQDHHPIKTQAHEQHPHQAHQEHQPGGQEAHQAVQSPQPFPYESEPPAFDFSASNAPALQFNTRNGHGDQMPCDGALSSPGQPIRIAASQPSQFQLPPSLPFPLGNEGGQHNPEDHSISIAGGSRSVSSTGPFTVLPDPLPLAMPSDKDWLTPLHCFVRRHCVQIFCASPQDVATPSKGKRKPIQVGQVGIRCPHCHPTGSQQTQVSNQRERGSVYYPTTISSIYNATMNLLQRHLHSCSAVPQEIMRHYGELKADDARSGTSKKYWIDSAKSLGLIDTPGGIRFSAHTPPPLPELSQQQQLTGVGSASRRNSNDFFSSTSNALPHSPEGTKELEATQEGKIMAPSQPTPFPKLESKGTLLPQSATALSESAPLVFPEDKPYATSFSFHLLSQMQPCVFTEADRLGKRKGLPAGFAGLACRHCFGGYGSGRFFPSSIKTLSDTSKTLNVLHNHMMRCRKCPSKIRGTLEKLRVHHDEERAKMKFGSQKAFFAKIWSRLHDSGNSHSPTSGTIMSKQTTTAPIMNGVMPYKMQGIVDAADASSSVGLAQFQQSVASMKRKFQPYSGMSDSMSTSGPAPSSMGMMGGESHAMGPVGEFDGFDMPRNGGGSTYDSMSYIPQQPPKRMRPSCV